MDLDLVDRRTGSPFILVSYSSLSSSCSSSTSRNGSGGMDNVRHTHPSSSSATTSRRETHESDPSMRFWTRSGWEGEVVIRMLPRLPLSLSLSTPSKRSALQHLRFRIRGCRVCQMGGKRFLEKLDNKNTICCPRLPLKPVESELEGEKAFLCCYRHTAGGGFELVRKRKNE